MSLRFAAYLGCTGTLAVLAITVPAAVLIGLFAGIVPGIMLGMAPTLFFYSVLWWLARELLFRSRALIVRGESEMGKRLARRATGVAAVLILIVPATMVPHTLNATIERAAAKLRAEDRGTSEPLTLPPVVAVVMRGKYDWVGKPPECDTVCQRLLYNGAVSRIIAADAWPPTVVQAFWIERRVDRCPKPPIASRDVIWPEDFGNGKSPEQRVRDRIAAGECLMSGEGNIEEAALVISYQQIKEGVSIFEAPWALVLDTVSAERLEIIEGAGRVLYRRTEVTAEPLSVPLLIETRAGLLTTVTYAGWWRSETTYSQIGPHAREVLPALLGAAGRPPDEPGP
jgi:hypothetical protein